MQSITINTYTFDELSEAAKRTAIEWYKNTYTDDDIWHYGVYDDFIELTKTLGITIDRKGIGFSGFWSQGDGSHFTETFNNTEIMEFIEAVNADKWKEYISGKAGELENLRKITITPRFKNLINGGNIDMTISTRSANHYSYMVDTWEFNTVNNNNNIPLIDSVIEGIISDVVYNLHTLNNWLYRQLETAYDYAQTDEYISEEIRANEYKFTEEGRRSFTL